MNKWITFPCFGLVLIFGHNIYADMDKAMPIRQQQQVKGQEQNLENLLNEHGRLLNEAILGALKNAPQNVIESVKKKLLENSHTIANIIGSHRGQQAAQSFEDLFNEHILIGSQYIDAIKVNNQELAEKLSNQAKANGDNIAKLLSSLIKSVSYNTWKKMLDQHVTLEAEQTKAYFKGDLNKAEQLRDQSLAQLREMADLISSGLLEKQSSENHP